MTKDPKEKQLRRMAERQGLKLTKSRRRDEFALDFNLFRLLDIGTDAVRFPIDDRLGASLGEIEAFLRRPRDKRA